MSSLPIVMDPNVLKNNLLSLISFFEMVKVCVFVFKTAKKVLDTSIIVLWIALAAHALAIIIHQQSLEAPDQYWLPLSK